MSEKKENNRKDVKVDKERRGMEEKIQREMEGKIQRCVYICE